MTYSWSMNSWSKVGGGSFWGTMEGSATCVLKSAEIKAGIRVSKVRLSQELQLSKEASVAEKPDRLQQAWTKEMGWALPAHKFFLVLPHSSFHLLPFLFFTE